MGYSFRLTARVLLYVRSHRQDSTYHGLCYTRCRALAGTKNSSMGSPWRIDPMTHHTMNECSYHRAISPLYMLGANMQKKKTSLLCLFRANACFVVEQRKGECSRNTWMIFEYFYLINGGKCPTQHVNDTILKICKNNEFRRVMLLNITVVSECRLEVWQTRTYFLLILIVSRIYQQSAHVMCLHFYTFLGT